MLHGSKWPPPASSSSRFSEVSSPHLGGGERLGQGVGGDLRSREGGGGQDLRRGRNYLIIWQEKEHGHSQVSLDVTRQLNTLIIFLKIENDNLYNHIDHSVKSDKGQFSQILRSLIT